MRLTPGLPIAGRHLCASLAAGAMLAAAPGVMAQEASPPSDDAPATAQACVNITSDAQRLACYDQALGHDSGAGKADTGTARQRVPITRPVESDGRERLFNHDRPAWARQGSSNTDDDQADAGHPSSLLDSRWELSRDAKLGTYNVRGYKPVYLLPVFYTTRVNNRPHSPSADNTVDSPLGLDRLEAKFQISFKTKLWQGVFGDYGDLWFGYTQTSHWQVYNHDISRPFRETNYEPEGMLVFNTNYDVFGWKGRLLGIGINHQSNGRSDPLSRSWNRVVADIGFERPGWTVMFRPWWRINESRRKDDNPDIDDYMGRGEVDIVHEAGENELSLMLRHSLRGGDRSHGAMQFTWSFPIHAKLRGYLQLFHGYGESMIDYNHKATYVGLGVSLLGWY